MAYRALTGRRLQQALRGRTMVADTDGVGRAQSRWNTIDHLAGPLKDVPGDVLEAGCWMGGMGAYMAAAFPERTVWLLDSFAGVEDPNHRTHPFAETTHRLGDHACTRRACERTLQAAGVTNAVIVQGYFHDTIPTLKPFDLALLRVDCDTYSGTREVLERLEPRVVAGGAVIVDDTNIAECWAAVREWAESHPVTLRHPWGDCPPVPWPESVPGLPGYWWRKEELSVRQAEQQAREMAAGYAQLIEGGRRVCS